MERKVVRVCNEEIEKQKLFIRNIKELNQGQLKKYYIDTFGCQMNENDSEKLAGMLSEMGFIPAKNEEDSDLILLNTCCVREHAEQKVFGHLGALKGLKKLKPELIIGICGCMMQQGAIVDEIRNKYKHVGLIFGTHNLYKFPEMLYSSITENVRTIEIWDTEGEIAEELPIVRKEGFKAFVTVMYGCNNFCSYCIVPFVRGRERSRLPVDIISEITKLAEEGYKEVTLLGQNVNSYGLDLEDKVLFPQLLEMVSEIEGIERIRFTTSHPKDLSNELIYVVRDNKKVCNHIHLPFQAGSSKVLKEMNRKYTKEQYLNLADKIKNEIPGVSLTTDIIVGFPGETEEDFLDTLDVLRTVKFDQVFTFLYSKRKGTPAADREDHITEEQRKDRFNRLLKLQETISKELNESFVGNVEKLLVEGESRTKPEYVTGRTDTHKIVNFKGCKELIGTFVDVKIINASTWWLEGEVI